MPALATASAPANMASQSRVRRPRVVFRRRFIDVRNGRSSASRAGHVVRAGEHRELRAMAIPGTHTSPLRFSIERDSLKMSRPEILAVESRTQLNVADLATTKFAR